MSLFTFYLIILTLLHGLCDRGRADQCLDCSPVNEPQRKYYKQANNSTIKDGSIPMQEDGTKKLHWEIKNFSSS